MQQQDLAFGDYRFEVETRRLWSGEREIRLTPKASDVPTAPGAAPGNTGSAPGNAGSAAPATPGAAPAGDAAKTPPASDGSKSNEVPK